MTSRSWRLHAACAGQDTLFFAAEGESKRGCAEREGKARALCAVCPVMGDCRDFALPRPMHGIWAGLDEKERAVMAAERGITRFCPAGEHLMTGANVYVNPAGFPKCRACRAAADRRDRARQAEGRRLRVVAA
jgi:WhiB family redox-sensing transcriptional regulator